MKEIGMYMEKAVGYHQPVPSSSFLPYYQEQNLSKLTKQDILLDQNRMIIQCTVMNQPRLAAHTKLIN